VNKKILSEIWVYPIKSLPGIRVSSATVLNKGLQGDRRFMLVDESNTFITQRDFPQMALFDMAMDNDTIRVRSRFNSQIGTLLIAPGTASSTAIKSVIWRDQVDVSEVNPSYSKWFSEVLKINCRLVFFPEEGIRRVDPEYVKEEHHVSLADGYPYLIIGRSSLNDLIERAGVNFSMQRFRPNFVFDGGEPYEEDAWKKFGVGSVRFAGVKPCARCVLTTVDPETGIKGEEPLRTLAAYRRKNGKIYFGENVIPLNLGEIKEGDEIKLF
jgi:uncharacterized protein